MRPIAFACVVLVSLAVALPACSSGGEKKTAPDPHGGGSLLEITQACQELAEKLKTFEVKGDSKGEAKPAIEILSVKNETPHWMDTQTVADQARGTLLDSGKFVVLIQTDSPNADYSLVTRISEWQPLEKGVGKKKTVYRFEIFDKRTKTSVLAATKEFPR